MKKFDITPIIESLDSKIVTKILEKSCMPVLDIVCIGNNLSSDKYVNLKKSIGEKLGFEVNVYRFSESDSGKIKDVISYIVNSSSTSGLIIQLPLPLGLDASILDLIPLNRDVDLLSRRSLDMFYSGNFVRLSPIIKSINHFISYANINPLTDAVVVIGDGRLVGKPVAFYLEKCGYKVRVENNYVKGSLIPENFVISCTGIPSLISGGDLVSNAKFIDFGSAVVNDRVCGDLDLLSPLDHVDLVSTSPGGMGPIVVRELLLNAIDFNTL